MSLQSICVGPRMIHRYLTLKSWTLFMYTEVMFSSGDVLPLWDALFSFQRAWHSVPQAVSSGVAVLGTQQRVDWFWGDKAQEGGAKLQSPSSNRGLMPFPVFEEQQGWTSSPTGVPQHLSMTGPLQNMPVTPTPWWEVLGSSLFLPCHLQKMKDILNPHHGRTNTNLIYVEMCITSCQFVGMQSLALPLTSLHQCWAPLHPQYGAVTIPLPSHTQPLAFPLSPAGALASSCFIQFPHWATSHFLSHTRKYVVFQQKTNMNLPSYSAPAVCQVRRKSAQSMSRQGCSRKSFSFPNHLLFLMPSTVVCLTPC